MRATCVLAVASLITSCSADLGVREPAREQVEDLLLARSQFLERSRRRGGGDRLLPRELLDHGSRNRRREERFAAGDDPDGGGDLFGRRVFEHEAAGTGAKRVVDIVVESERRQDENTRARLSRHDATGRLDPVEHGHAYVHQDDVGPQAARFRDRLLAVARLADDVCLRLGVEDLAQTDADKRLVVCDQNGCHRIGSRTRTAKPPPGRRPASRRPP